MKTTLLFIFAFYFSTLPIIAHRTPHEILYVHTDRNNFQAGDTVWFQAYLMDTRPEAENYSHFVYAELLHDTLIVAKEKIKAGEDGFAGYLPLPDSIGPGNYMLRFYTRYLASLPAPRYYHSPIIVGTPLPAPLPLPTTENTGTFHVSFFPEGGNFPTGTLTRIAFKALQNGGLGLNITGYIANQYGDSIINFKSDHLGMRSFAFEAKPGGKYTAVCLYKGEERQFALPEPEDDAVSIWAHPYKKDEIIIGLRKNPAPATPDRYALKVEHGDSVWANISIHPNDICRLSKSMFPAGVLRFTLTGNDGFPLSTRSILNVPQGLQPKKQIETKRTAEKEGADQCNIEINLTDGMNMPLDGSISLSVTDTRYAIQDTTANILSAYLLTPDIRGYIEQPASYFTRDSLYDLYRQDLLMLTQGWTKFEVQKDTASIPTESSKETAQQIRGRITPDWSTDKGISGAVVTLLSFDGKIFKETTADKNGCFCFDGMSFAQNTYFLLQARKAKGGTHVAIHVDKEKSPETVHGQQPFVRWHQLYAKQKEKQQALLHENDEINPTNNIAWEMELGEVTIKENKIKKKQTLNPGASRVHSEFNKLYTPKEMTHSPYASVRNFMTHIPGVKYDIDEIEMREFYIIQRYGENKPAMLMIDGLEVAFGEFVNFPISAVESIEVIKDVAGLVTLGGRAANGAIMLISKPDAAGGHKKSNFSITKPLGYQVKRQFYVPAYPIDPKSRGDRSDEKTIYWQPAVKVSEGKANIKFTAPSPAPLLIVIQGVTDNGKLISICKQL